MVREVSRIDYKKTVRETRTEPHSQDLGSWDHLVDLLFGKLAGQDSLRGVEAELATQSNKL